MKQISIDIIGIPLDLGVKELGLKLGPDALREAGLIPVLDKLGIDVCDKGNIAPPASGVVQDNSDNHAGMIASCCQMLSEMVRESVEAGRIPICLGGDHSLSIGSLGGMASHIENIGCIWMDAHPDANTPETSLSGNIHGMPVAIVLGHGPDILVDVKRAGAKVRHSSMSLLGTRDADAGELDFIYKHDIQHFTVFDVLDQGLPSVVQQVIKQVTKDTDGVHVSLDLDVLHEGIAPGVGLPSRCGFNMREATYICRRIAAECNVCSVDIAGLNPVRDRDKKTAKLAIELLTTLLGQDFSFGYDEYLRKQTQQLTQRSSVNAE